MLLNLQINNDNINLLNDISYVDSKILKTEIELLIHTADLPNVKNVNIKNLFNGCQYLVLE